MHSPSHLTTQHILSPDALTFTLNHSTHFITWCTHLHKGLCMWFCHWLGTCYWSETEEKISAISFYGASTRICPSIHGCPTRLWRGAGRSSEVERSLMVQWVIGSILHGVDPLSYFSFQLVLHCGMVHIKEPLLLIDKSSLCGGSWIPFSLSECLTPYSCR